MCNIKYANVGSMFPLMKEVFRKGGSVCITMTGNSMKPFLRGEIDSIELSAADFTCIRNGDIVLAKRDRGQYVLHRVYKICSSHFYINGDAQLWVEGPLRPDQLAAVVTAVHRGKKRISCSGISWKLFSCLWMHTFPFRGILFKLYACIKSWINCAKYISVLSFFIRM